MTHPALRSLWLLCATALLSCTSAPQKPDKPTPRPLNPGLALLIEQIPASMPVLVTMQVDRLAGLDASFREILGEHLPPDSQDPIQRAIFEMIGDLDAARLPDLAGLDTGRPLVAGFLAPPPSNQYDAIIYGNIPDLTETPRAMHARILLPATDASALAESLSGWAQTQGAAILPMGGEIAGLGGGSALTLGQKAIAIIPRADAVQIDLIEGTFRLDDATAALSACLTSRGAPRTMTPAMVHLLEGEDAIALHLDMEGLARITALSGTILLGTALSHASEEMIGRMWAAGASLVLSTATWMNAFDRNVRDVTVSVSAVGGLETRITRSLTEAAQSAHETARPKRGRVYRPLSKTPLLVVQLGASARALGAARGPVTSTQGKLLDMDELMTLLNEGGSFMSLYTLLNTPTLLTGALQHEGAPVAGIFPDSLTVVIKELTITRESKVRLIMALIAEYPRGPLDPTLSKLLSMLESNLGEELPDHAFHKDVRQSAERTVLRLGIGIQPEALIDMDKPITPEVDLGLTLDIDRLSKVLVGDPPPASTRALRLGGRVEIVDESAGDCQSTRARYLTGAAVGQVAPEPLRAILTPSAGPIPSTTLTEGHRCLVRLSAAISETFRILAHASPQMKGRLLDQVLIDMDKDLACARLHPETATIADEVESGWHLFFARDHALSRMEDDALKRARAACDLGREPACELMETLKPAWPEGSLTVPQIAWPQPERPMNVEHALTVTSEGVYVDKARVADLDKIAEPGEGPLPWLVEALGKNLGGATGARDTAIELKLDRRLGGAQVRRMMRSARAAGFAHAWISMMNKEKRVGAEHVLLGGDRVAQGFWPFHDAPPDEGEAYVRLSGERVELMRTGLPGTSIRLDDERAPLRVAGWVVEQSRGPGRARLIHIEDTADRPWFETLRVLAPLKVGWEQVPASLDESERLISTWSGRTPVIFVFDSPQPAASKAGITGVIGGEPVLGPSLTKEEIGGNIKRLVPKVKACAQKSLIEDPSPTTRITISFAIQSDGSTRDAKVVQNTGNDRAMAACIEGVFEKARFPKPRGGGIVRVKYPFIFDRVQ